MWIKIYLCMYIYIYLADLNLQEWKDLRGIFDTLATFNLITKISKKNYCFSNKNYLRGSKDFKMSSLAITSQ